MKLKASFSLLLLLFLSIISFAQPTVKVYRTKAGKLYSVAQKDSIKALGFPISLADETILGDTTYVEFEILPKESAFVRKYSNKPLPAFSLKALDGTVINRATLQGKVVMMNFWSTTCGPCIAEMPELNRLKKHFKEVVFLAPAPEDAATIQKLLAKHAFEFVILPNAQALFEEWGIDAYPKNFFVDHQGVIRVVKEGTPILNERDAQGKIQLAVETTYSPILKHLITDKSK